MSEVYRTLEEAVYAADQDPDTTYRRVVVRQSKAGFTYHVSLLPGSGIMFMSNTIVPAWRNADGKWVYGDDLSDPNQYTVF